MNLTIARADPSPDLKEVAVAVSSTFTRIPKVHQLVQAGVPTEVIPTYAALADHANNRTGVCWPKMTTLARRLKRTPRTIQRHLHLLQDLGLITFVRRLRDERGCFGAYVYRLIHIAAVTARKGAERIGGRSERRRSRKNHSTGNGGPTVPIKGLTKHKEVPPNPPKKDRTYGFWWSFDQEAPPGAEEEYRRDAQERREQAARRRREGFDWLFG